MLKPKTALISKPTLHTHSRHKMMLCNVKDYLSCQVLGCVSTELNFSATWTAKATVSIPTVRSKVKRLSGTWAANLLAFNIK